jgi:hypothetical protein
MRRALIHVANIALALVAGVLMLLIWERTYAYVGTRWFQPATTLHYEVAHYRDINPIRDLLIFNASIAVAVGLTISLVLGAVLRLRWFVLAPILLGVVSFLTWVLITSHDFHPFWMLFGWTPYLFVLSTFTGSWLGERVRSRYVAV